MKRKIKKRYSAIILVIALIIFGYELYQDMYVIPVPIAENEIQLTKCVDGDTAHFTKIGKTRFLFIDTPESTNKIEPYGKQAADFTCNMLENAQQITYEYDGPIKDKYDRTLAWIFVDGELLQELIAKEGYVKKFYQYQDKYKYELRIRRNLNDKFGIFEGK